MACIFDDLETMLQIDKKTKWRKDGFDFLILGVSPPWWELQNGQPQNSVVGLAPRLH